MLLAMCLSFVASLPGAAAVHDSVEQAKDQFRTVTEGDVEQAQTAVRRAMSAVDKYLSQHTSRAIRWKKYVMWDRQQQQLSNAESLDPAFWRRVLWRETQNHAGLDHVSFQQHRAAVRKLIDVVEASRWPNPEDEYDQAFAALAKILPRHKEELSAQEAEETTRLLTLLHRRQQAASLVQTIRASYTYPNLVVSVPATMIEQVGEQKLQREFDVDDVLNGAAVTGKGRLNAKSRFSLLENREKGVIRVDIIGSTNSDTRSTRQGVTVQSRNVLRFASATAMGVGPSGLSVRPFKTNANLDTEILSISTPYRSRRDAAARREVDARQEADRQLAQRRAIDDLSLAFDQEMGATIKPVNAFYEDNVIRPLNCFDEFPNDVHVFSNETRLDIRAVFAEQYQLAALVAAPAVGDETTLTVVVHQSAFNNTANAMLAWQTISLRAALNSLLGLLLPTEVADDDPLYITFAREHPLSVSFEEGQIAISLSAHGYRYRGQRYSGMDIRLALRPEHTAEGWSLVQSSAPQVMLPILPDGRRPRLGIRDYALRRILTNVIKRDVPSRLELRATNLPPPLDLLEPLAASEVLVKDGWFCMAVESRTQTTAD